MKKANLVKDPIPRGGQRNAPPRSGAAWCLPGRGGVRDNGHAARTACDQGATLNVDVYLRRIEYDGPREPTAATLRALHEAHRRTVPFENLDIVCGRPIALDDAALFEKIVVRRRGGFCHELNRLFAWLLQELGFPTILLGADSVTAPTGEVFPPLSHQMLLVPLTERWLADVGFGARGPRVPLNLDETGDQEDGASRFRIERGAGARYILRHWLDGAWRPIYDFTLQPRQPDDFAERCRQQQREPYWAAQRLCTRTTPTGHVSLHDRRLIVVEGGVRHERRLASEAEVARALRDLFGIDGGAGSWGRVVGEGR